MELLPWFLAVTCGLVMLKYIMPKHSGPAGDAHLPHPTPVEHEEIQRTRRAIKQYNKFTIQNGGGENLKKASEMLRCLPSLNEQLNRLEKYMVDSETTENELASCIVEKRRIVQGLTELQKILLEEERTQRAH